MFLTDAEQRARPHISPNQLGGGEMMDERERRIKARAFELWQREGSLDGRSLGHWLQAEREIEQEELEDSGENGSKPETLAPSRKASR